jgi:hypothetical protein
MNGDLIDRVKDGPFLNKPKNVTKAPSGKQAAEAPPKAAE